MGKHQFVHVRSGKLVCLRSYEGKALQRDFHPLAVADEPHVVGHDLPDRGFKHRLRQGVPARGQRCGNPGALGFDLGFQPVEIRHRAGFACGGTARKVAAAHGAGERVEDAPVVQAGHRAPESVVRGEHTAELDFGKLHFHGRGGEIHAALFAVVKERGLVAGHQRVLEMPQAFGIDMAHFHVERRPVAFDLLLVGAAHLKLAGAVFHHGMVAAHEPLAEGVELVRARAVDAVHPGAAEALGDERGLLLDVHVDDVRPGFVGQHELAAGIEGAVPRVVGVARGVGGGAVAAVAEREDHPRRPDDVEGAVEHVVSGRADHPPVLFEELRDHHVVEHVRAH